MKSLLSVTFFERRLEAISSSSLASWGISWAFEFILMRKARRKISERKSN
jgi:hypothetical protein